MAYDAKSGLINMNARLYDVSVGRFMTEDTYPGEMSNTQSLNRYSYVMNNPINYWDPTGHVAEAMDGDVLALPDGFNQIPSWVRANDSHTVQDPENENLYTVWTSLGSPSFEQGPTEMTNSVQYAKYYLQTYQRDVTTTWYYQYEKYRIVQDIPRSYEKSDPQKFQELVTYEWEYKLSAEDVAKQSQAEIAKYGIPPNAKIVSRKATLPQQYDRWLRNELDRQFKRIEPTAPRTYSVHDGEPEFTLESMRRVLGDPRTTATPDGLAPYTIFTFNFFTEDIRTITSEESTTGEKIFAASSFFLKPVKVVDEGSDLLKAYEKVETVTKGTPKLTKPAAGDNIGYGLKGTDNDAYGGYYKRKQQRTEDYQNNVTNPMTKANLPNKGSFRFVPGKEVKLNKQLGGYVDKFGNVWVKGPYHGDPSKNFQFEWDVQLSEKGMKEWGEYTKNGKKYINVTPDGTLSH